MAELSVTLVVALELESDLIDLVKSALVGCFEIPAFGGSGPEFFLVGAVGFELALGAAAGTGFLLG